MFNNLINNAGHTEDTLGKSTDDIKLEGVSDIVKCKASNQRGLGKFEDQANRNLMKFNNGKKKGVHLGWTNPTHWSRLRRDCPSGSSIQEAEKGFTMTARLSMSP